jgi:hypothetical protein
MWKNGHKRKQRCLKDNSGSCVGTKCTSAVMYSRIKGKESMMKVILALKGRLNICSCLLTWKWNRIVI